MELDEAISYFGNGNKLCEALGIARTNITYWRKRGNISSFSQAAIEDITNGELKAHCVAKKVNKKESS